MSTLDFNIRVIKEYIKMVKNKVKRVVGYSEKNNSETGYSTNKQKKCILVISA